MGDLTAKQQAFVDEYLIDRNATQAAIRAGYSAKTAYSQGQRLLKNVEVLAAVSGGLKGLSEATGITAARVILELARLGTSDVRRMFNEHGSLLSIVNLSDDAAAAVSSIKVVTKRLPTGDGEPAEVEYISEIKLWDKNSALEKLGKHLKLFTEVHEHTLSEDMAAWLDQR